MNILQEADGLIHGDRHDAYGDARTEFERVGQVWGGIIGCAVSARQVALCMAGLKLIREAHRHKRDNLVDAAGYIGLIEEIEKEDLPKPGTCVKVKHP